MRSSPHFWEVAYEMTKWNCASRQTNGSDPINAAADTWRQSVPSQPTASGNNNANVATPALARLQIIDIKVTSEGLCVQWKTSRGRTEGVSVTEGKVRETDNTWTGRRVGRVEARWGSDSWSQSEAPGWLSRPCFPFSSASLLRFLSQLFFIFAFQGDSLPPHVCMLTGILQTQSHLSSHRQPLNTLFRHRHLRNCFSSPFPISTAGTLLSTFHYFPLPSIVYRITLDLMTAFLAFTVVFSGFFHIDVGHRGQRGQRSHL